MGQVFTFPPYETFVRLSGFDMSGQPRAQPVTVSLQDSSQIELLKELMDLQKDMVVMLLSMLEGRSEDNLELRSE